MASSTLLSSSVPGTVGTPASRATFLAVALSPRAFMFSGVGPMKVIPCSRHISAKVAFSARKP